MQQSSVPSREFVRCRKCQYEKNLATDKRCQFCGASLQRQDSVLTLMLLGLGGLGILGTGTFILRDRFPVRLPTQAVGNRVILPGQVPSTIGSGVQTKAMGGGFIEGSVAQVYQRISDVTNVPKGIFNYGGSTTFAPLRSANVMQAIAQAFPGYQLRYTEPIIGQPGSGTGIRMLIQSQLSFSQSSRSLKSAELIQSKARGYPLEEVPVALDGIALFVNPQLMKQGVDRLTVTQVQDIFTGKIQNWNLLGGPDLKIVPFSRDLNAGGTVDFFYENVLKQQPLGLNVRSLRDTTQGIRAVATQPGGVSYASAAEVVGQQSIAPLKLSKRAGDPYISPCQTSGCTSINAESFKQGSYPITRRLLVIVKRDGKMDEQAGVAYANMLLSSEGQQLISQAGFISLR